MQFNSEELKVAASLSYKFDKEGILYMKEKQNRNDVFGKRWCRKRGNLLYYHKTEDQYSEPTGVFVLEDYRVCIDESPEFPYCFSLNFKHDKVGQQFGAYSESERNSWVQTLRTASFKWLQSQISNLQAKLAALKVTNGFIPSDSEFVYNKRQRSFTTGSGYDPPHYEPLMELSISCDNLMCGADGRAPTPIVCILFKTPPSVRWTRFAQTEVIERSIDPYFFVTVTLFKGEVNEFTQFKLSVYDVKERVSGTCTLLGESVFTLEVLQIHHYKLRLELRSPFYESVGYVSISAPEMTDTKQKNAWLLLAKDESLSSKVERPRSYSLPTKLTSRVGIPEIGLLKTLSNNFITQSYRCHSALGAEMHVREILSESKLSFTVPCMLLDLWINEEKKLLETLIEPNQFPKEWKQKVLAAAVGHLQLADYYSEVRDFLLKQKGSSFKQSIKKADGMFEFVPTNLHIQRMWVKNVATSKTGVHDIITVGAFAAYSHKFRQGGLLQLLDQLKSYDPGVRNNENNCTILGPGPISRSVGAVLRTEQLQEEIVSDLKIISGLFDKKYKPNIQTLLNSLSKESTKCLHLSQEIRYRRDVVFSQSLTSLVTGLMTRLWCQNPPDSMFIQMLSTVGVLCHFVCLLSCYKEGKGAIEDMVIAIDDLRRVKFWLEPSSSCNPQPRIEGNRLSLHVFIPAPLSVITLLPAHFQAGYHFTICSVFFNIGINEKATIAEWLGYTSFEDKINQDSLRLLKEYFSRFQRIPKSKRSQGLHCVENHIATLFEQLQYEIYAKKNKNVEILHLSSEICKYFGGIRFTSCKSGKDRTGMSVTLEQAMVLLNYFNMDHKEMPHILKCMRSEGTRLENAFKNLGKRQYHITTLQLPHLPNLYRPHPGTYTDDF